MNRLRDERGRFINRGRDNISRGISRAQPKPSKISTPKIRSSSISQQARIEEDIIVEEVT